MKHLLDYIVESIQINEAQKTGNLSNRNYICGSNGVKDYHYSIAVISDLLADKQVKLINGKTINKSMFNGSLDKLLEKTQSMNGDYNDFNNCFDETNLSNIGIKSLSQVWNSILKLPYSKGSSDGGNAEIVVCNAFNNNFSDEEIASYASKYQINGNVWLPSIKNTLRILNNQKFTNEKYVAAQVDGKGINDIKNTGSLSKEDIKNITIAYSNKKLAGKLFGIDINKLYPNSSKDSWNKADIVLINKTENVFDKLKERLSTLEGDADQSIEYNETLVTMALDGDIIPISLKKVPDNSANWYSHGFKEIEHFEIDGDVAELQLPANDLKNDLNGSIYLATTDNKDIETDAKDNKSQTRVQFFARASSKNKVNGGNATAKIELQYENSKGGSGFNNICSELGIQTKDSYATPDRVKEAVKEYFEWNELPSVVAASNNWFNKPCFTVLIGLLDRYCEVNKYEHNIDVLTPFTKFAIGCCLGTGSYYIIK